MNTGGGGGRRGCYWQKTDKGVLKCHIVSCGNLQPLVAVPCVLPLWRPAPLVHCFVRDVSWCRLHAVTGLQLLGLLANKTTQTALTNVLWAKWSGNWHRTPFPEPFLLPQSPRALLRDLLLWRALSVWHKGSVQAFSLHTGSLPSY